MNSHIPEDNIKENPTLFGPMCLVVTAGRLFIDVLVTRIGGSSPAPRIEN